MKLKVDILKPSGKWYTDEIITIPDNIQDSDVSDYIKCNAIIRNMMYLYSSIKYGIPTIVHVGE